MQIFCHNCRTTLNVSDAGGQFQCPSCHAVNSVATAVVPETTSSDKNDKRKAIVLVGSLALGGLAVSTETLGLGIGLLLLMWSIASAFQKVRSPLAFALPDSKRRTLLVGLSIAAGVQVSICGVGGHLAASARKEHEAEDAQEAIARKVAAEDERRRVASDKAAQAEARERELLADASGTASKYHAELSKAEELINQNRLDQASAITSELAGTLKEYMGLSDVPEPMLTLESRHQTIVKQIEKKLHKRELLEWIESTRAAVGDKTRCRNEEEISAFQERSAILLKRAPEHPQLLALSKKLAVCKERMPPPSKWAYRAWDDRMGKSVATAVIVSDNSFEFSFPYKGAQHARLTIRKKKGTDVMLSIERGQFMCSMGCSVDVRVDDNEVVRWRASGTADHSSTTIFLRREAKLVKALSKATTLRIESQFYNEGSRVFEFAVSRFDKGRLRAQ